MAVTLSRSTVIMLEFTFHVFAGVIGFVIVTSAGVLVYAYTGVIESHKLAPDFIVVIMGWLGDGIFVLDVA